VKPTVTVQRKWRPWRGRTVDPFRVGAIRCGAVRGRRAEKRALAPRLLTVHPFGGGTPTGPKESQDFRSCRSFPVRTSPSGLFLKPFEEIEIIPVRIAQAGYARSPILILRFTLEDNTLGPRVGIDSVNVFYREAYVVDPGWVIE
jgi:hypothetical protein